MNRFATNPIDRRQITLFSPTLEESIAPDHPVRLYDEILAQCRWDDWEKRYCLKAGQPPIHPRILASVILYGLGRGIRSSRLLEYLCGNALDYIWLARGHQPDHSTLCQFRRRFEKELKGLFRQLAQVAIDMELASLVTIALDGSRVRANSSRHATLGQKTMEENLRNLEGQIEKLFGEMAHNDAQSKKLHRTAFVFDPQANCYYCPMGRQLVYIGPHTKPRKHGAAVYQAYRSPDCSACALSEQCLNGKKLPRTVYREQHEELREAMDKRMASPAGKKIYRQRNWIAETPFAVIKAIMHLRQFLTRGIDKVRTEWLWACTGFNLAKLVRYRAKLRATTAQKAV